MDSMLQGLFDADPPGDRLNCPWGFQTLISHY